MEPEKVIQIMHSESADASDIYSTFMVLTNHGRIFNHVHKNDGNKGYLEWVEIELPIESCK